MTQIEKDNIIKILQEHVNKVSALPYKDYVSAEALYTRTMFLYKKYFKESVISIDDLYKVNFRSVNVGTTAEAAWNESQGRLLSFSQSMLDELQLPPGFSNITASEIAWKQVKVLYSGTFLILSSVVLWSFNAWAKWGWLTTHTKRIAIYLSFQVTIALITALLLTKNKQVRSIEWLGLALAMASIIISSVA